MTNSNQDMIKMQQDAIKRVREMHARAKLSVEGKNNTTTKNIDTKFKDNIDKINSNNICTKNNNIPAKSKSIQNRKHNSPLKIFDLLIKDEERSLILILLILLMSEEDNISILLTLVYLLV